MSPGDPVIYSPDWPAGVEYDAELIALNNDEATIRVRAKRGSDRPDPHAGAEWAPPLRSVLPAGGILW